ncbi:S41 family peptidase [Thermohalobacter berrensis]|uniref:Peptidase S41 n=1 Tax=Thermohalobacter berrensis TaxID=99594 RepID=A0A419SY29_9FIRM|nr:S41 family peptidase [Thermohalobacter berrensis]RKD30091.1 peptidase S41 [Thermohalobacter berrensis]
MISRRKAILGAIIIILITSLSTFVLSNIIQITIDDKVLITKNDYEKLMDVYKKYEKVIAIENMVKQNFLNDVEDKDLVEGQIKGMFQALGDPYSVYMTKDEFTSFMEHTKGTYGGIGIIVAPGEDNLITVVSPIEDTPGERAGIKPGDKIVKVNGKEFTADKMDDAVKVMKGKPKTNVDITILRKDENGNSKFIDLTITRETIRLKSVKSKMLKDKIGYIRIISFDELTYEDFMKHLEKLQDNGMKGLIIDLRNNPGGLLSETVEIADELIGKSVVVYTETKNGEREYRRSDADKLNIPFVVLVNEGSASASEILSGAVKDTNSGILIGTKTFGKGIVQRITQLKDGSGFKLTVSEYFTPSGVSIHGKGIEPDIVLENPDDIEQIGVKNIEEDKQLQKAIEVIKEEIGK